MSKKNKPKGRASSAKSSVAHGQPHNKPKPSLSPEQKYIAQMTKAQKYFEAEAYDEVINLLEPLAEKNPGSIELLELLGASYSQLEDYENALDKFEQVLNLTSKNGQPHAMEHYNLAHLYTMTGYPLLAFEQLEKVNWQEMADEVGTVAELREMLDEAGSAIDEMASAEKQNREQFMKAGLPLERGDLALQRDQFEVARSSFETARQARPDAPSVYNSLAQLALAENDFEQALTYSRYVIDKLAPHDLPALTTIISLLLDRGDRVQAEKFYNSVKNLPVPETPEEIHRLAHIHTLFENDRAVYDLAEVYFSKIVDLEEWDVPEPGSRTEMALYRAVAAAHLDKKSEARDYLAELNDLSADMLIQRTFQSLQNNEPGPRAAGRFYYNSPLEVPGSESILEQISDIVTAAGAASRNANDDLSGPTSVAQLDDSVLDVIRFVAWLNNESQDI